MLGMNQRLDGIFGDEMSFLNKRYTEYALNLR